MSYWLITSDLENQISQEVREIIPSQCSESRPAPRDTLFSASVLPISFPTWRFWWRCVVYGDVGARGRRFFTWCEQKVSSLHLKGAQLPQNKF